MWRMAEENTSRLQDDCFIATTTAILMGASAAASAYAAHKQSSTAAKTAQLQTDAANHAADLQGKGNDDALAFQKQQAAIADQRYETDRRANYDQYLSHYKGAQSLGDSIGFHMADAPGYVSGNQPAPLGAPGGAPSGPGPSGSSQSGGAADLKTMIDGGMDPQQAVQTFNQKYGRTTGNEATYYGADVHGTPTIGLPEAYLSLEPQGWSVTQRQQGGGGGAAGTIGGLLGSQAQPGAMLTAPPKTFRLGTIGNAFQRAQ